MLAGMQECTFDALDFSYRKTPRAIAIRKKVHAALSVNSASTVSLQKCPRSIGVATKLPCIPLNDYNYRYLHPSNFNVKVISVSAHCATIN
jgi:hypothetical protein